MTVYLSASRQDILLREALVAALEEGGETVWWDEQRGHGESWWHNSVRQLRRCDVFVFALSYSSLASDICQAELKYAREIGKPILPVLVGSVGREQDNPFADNPFVESAVEFRRPSAQAAIELQNRVRGLRGFSVLTGRTQSASPSHTSSTGGIFISYRRGNENFFATWLYDKLAGRFGKSRVFIDVDSIDLGLDFTEVIDEKLSHCVVMLVVIGKDWVTVTDSSGKHRLQNSADFVRLEVEKGLTRPGVRVIPIYVDGALPPRADDLPESLAKLAVKNGIDISHAASESGLERLVKTLEPLVGQG